MNSSRAPADYNLARITARKARHFLIELVNLREGDAAAERFETRFKEFQRSSGSSLQTFATDFVDCSVDASLTSKGTIDLRHHDLFKMRDELRLIWTTRDLKTKEWRIFLFRSDPSMSVDVLSARGLPAPNAFHQAVMYLSKWAAKTRFCNNPDCSSPYFLAGRKSQKYCNEDCAIPAQRACKRDWWRKHGAAWRRKKRAPRPKNSNTTWEGIPKTTKPNP